MKAETVLKTVTKKELKGLKAVNFAEGDLIDVVDKLGNIIYTIRISFGGYGLPLKTTVEDKNYKLLSCTPGTPGGWPYYIADFIQALKNE